VRWTDESRLFFRSNELGQRRPSRVTHFGARLTKCQSGTEVSFFKMKRVRRFWWAALGHQHVTVISDGVAFVIVSTNHAGP
jgi:hypothetical protein